MNVVTPKVYETDINVYWCKHKAALPTSWPIYPHKNLKHNMENVLRVSFLIILFLSHVMSLEISEKKY
jgi:hypothetical protein